MNSKLFWFAVFSLILTTGFSQKDHTYFAFSPTLTPDGNTIVFSYDGDLWKVDADGGEAYRITAMDGNESNPSVSPDGKWLAFSSNQYGNSDIYIMPLDGGAIKQLTFHDSSDNLSSWSWDSKHLYFTSARLNNLSTYKIGIKGGTPVRLFGHYFNTIHNVVEHPNGDELFFNESWESGRFAHRKRYKGDYNPDIKSYNLKTKEYKEHTSYNGKDFAATIDKNGNLYFKSDQANGEYNIYTFENGNKKQLTTFDTSVMWPKVAANGSKIVFTKDYQIHVYDVQSGKTSKPAIHLAVNNTLDKDQSFSVKGKITSFDVSEDGKKMVFVSRGRLFISDIKGKFVQAVNTDNTEAVGEVHWLKDNKTILFGQSVKGYYNWFTISADGNGKVKQLTDDTMNNRQMNFNSDKSKGVYLRGRNDICLMDMNTLKSEVIVKDELWAMYNSNPYFSPDDKYIVYNAYRDFETDIFVYNLSTKSSKNLTNTKVSESGPYWSQDGKYLYFSSDRIQPGYPFGTRNAKIYQMALDNFEAPFKSDKLAELFKEKDKDKDKDKGAKDDKKEGDKKVQVTINPNGIMERIQVISPGFGQQGGPLVIQKDQKTYVFYSSNHSEGKSMLWRTTIEPFERNKTEKVSDKPIRGYSFVEANKKYYMLVGGAINTFDPVGNKLKPINIDYKFNKSLNDEFEQMYYEAWAGMEENFYDSGFHGQNWQALRDRYAKFLPYVRNRNHLRRISNDMLGELNTSHFGFNSFGNEENIFHKTRTLNTGIVFNDANPYQIERIIKQSPADKKGKNLRKGDVLVAVNGVKIKNSKNREYYFSNADTAEEISLTFDRNGTEFTTKFHPTSSGAIRSLVYDEWQDQNQAYVDKKSNNQIAYVHMKNMGGGELAKFKHDMVSSEASKKALILDLRYNTGGNVHDEVLQFLSRRTYLNWKYREGKATGQSNFGFSGKPIILLINEQSLSDAEMTAAGFKALGLGTIIGTETYRWIIFTSGKSLVDGSFYRLPSWGCYTLDGQNLEAVGVAPDVYVGKSFKDRINNTHPQLDSAIDMILKELK